VDKITVGSIADSKPSFTVGTQVPATPTLGAGEFALWVGTNVRDLNLSMVISGINHLAAHFREDGWPVGPLALNIGFYDPLTHTHTFLNSATFPGGISEDDIMLAYEEAFYDAGNSNNFGNLITRVIEVYQEQIAKLN
jgi:hypothetical protein